MDCTSWLASHSNWWPILIYNFVLPVPNYSGFWFVSDPAFLSIPPGTCLCVEFCTPEILYFVPESKFVPKCPEHPMIWTCILNFVSLNLSIALYLSLDIYMNVLSYKLCSSCNVTQHSYSWIATQHCVPILQLTSAVTILWLKSVFNLAIIENCVIACSIALQI